MYISTKKECTMEEPILNFDLSNVSDIELPPTAGIREFRIEEPPVLANKDRTVNGQTVSKLLMIAKLKINDGGKGVYPEDEQDRQVYQEFDMNDSRAKIQAKRMFLAAGVAAIDFASASQQIVHKPFRGLFKQTNGKRKDGTPAVFFNLVDWIVDASMLTNVPGRTPPVPQVQA